MASKDKLDLQILITTDPKHVDGIYGLLLYFNINFGPVSDVKDLQTRLCSSITLRPLNPKADLVLRDLNNLAKEKMPLIPLVYNMSTLGEIVFTPTENTYPDIHIVIDKKYKSVLTNVNISNVRITCHKVRDLDVVNGANPVYQLKYFELVEVHQSPREILVMSFIKAMEIRQNNPDALPDYLKTCFGVYMRNSISTVIKGKPKVSNNRITPEHIQQILKTRVTHHTETVTDPTPHVRTTIWLDGKFMLSSAISKSVDPVNFDEEMGRHYSYKSAVKLAEEKLWELEGYRLHDKLHNPE